MISRMKPQGATAKGWTSVRRFLSLLTCWTVLAATCAASGAVTRFALSPNLVRLMRGETCRFVVAPVPRSLGEGGAVTEPSAPAPRVVEWSVNEVPGGGPESGVITADGTYTAPAKMPPVTEISIRATLDTKPARYLWATVTWGKRRPQYYPVEWWPRLNYLRWPHGITYDPNDGTVLITGMSHGVVDRITRDGKLLAKISVPGGFKGPRACAVAADGSIYVADGDVGRVWHLTRDGKLLGSFGEAGKGPGKLGRLHGIAIGRDGRIYVSDIYNRCVHVFDPAGKLLFEWGTRGHGPGQFEGPHGVAVDPNGDVIVCEYEGARCQKFTPDGDYIMTFAQRPRDGAHCYHSLACDSRGNVYLAARDNVEGATVVTIAKYNSEGSFITSLRLPRSARRHFHAEWAAVGDRGRVYVTEGTGVSVWAPDAASESPLAAQGLPTPCAGVLPPRVVVRRADLEEATRTMRAFLDAFVAGNLDAAAAYSTDPFGEGHTIFEGRLAAWMKQLQPSRVASVGPAKVGGRNSESIDVPFRLEGAQTVVGGARLLKEQPPVGWRIDEVHMSAADTAADLQEAERIAKAIWEALIAGNYSEAATYWDVPDSERGRVEKGIESWMKELKPTHVTQLGAARQDPSNPQVILVPLKVEGAQTQTMDTRVGRDDPSQKWSFWGTSTR